MKTKTQLTNRILSLVLSIMMVVSMLPMNILTANAAETTKSAIDLSTLTGTYVISDSGEYTFIGSGSYAIKVESGNPTIVLNNASITVGEGSAIDVASSSNATIFVLGDNTIGTTKTEYSDVPCGGIFVAEGGTVNITSNGTDNILRARGTLAAAIGGKYILYSESYNAGNISISNVTVYAYTNDNYAAAIGAAGRGSCGTINITNAAVYAYGAGDEYTSAPGIGSAWNHVGWSETIPVVIISDSEIHTFRYNPYSDYIGYLGDESGEEGGFHATGSINCGEGGSVKSSTIYCYTGLDATTTDKVVKYGALGGLLKEDGTCEGEHSGGTQTCMGYKCANCGNWFGEKNDTHDWSNKDGICANGCELTCDHESYTEGGCDVCDYACTHTTEKDENKATCKHGDICDLCGTEYGNQDADNHTGTLGTPVPAEDGKHTATWSCCEATVTEEHTFENGKCTACGIPVCTCTVKCGETVDTTCTVCSADPTACEVEEPPVAATNNIDAAAMTPEELKAAVDAALAAGYTAITVNLAEDADTEMFTALRTALAESTAPDGSINLTISGAKTVPDEGFIDMLDYFENDDKNIAGDKLKSLTLTDVETIGEYAFSACTNLEAVNMPKVVTIGEYAFNEWKKGTKLTSLDLPNATTIGDCAFAYSSLLTSVNLPKVTSIGMHAFGYCDLRTLDLPEVTTIDGEAFLNNDNLVSCSAPKATTIGYYPWGNCSRLETLELTAAGGFTLSNNLFANTPTGQINLVLNKDKESQVTQNADGTATWKTTNSNGGKLEYTFKSITFVYSIEVSAIENGTVTADKSTATEGETVTLTVTAAEGYILDTLTVMNGGTPVEVTGNSFTMPAGDVTVSATFKACDHSGGAHTSATDLGDGKHSFTCSVCDTSVTEPHSIGTDGKCACGAMEIVVSFDAGDYEWKTGETLYFCRVSRDNEWEEYCFTATVDENGAVTWTPDKPLYWDGTGEHRLFVSYPCTTIGWDDFAIPTDQSDAEKLKAADCMNARWVGIPTTDVINFELKHRMAKITVEYVLASQFDGSEDVTAQIHSNAKYCIFSDADGLPMNTSVGQYDAWVTPHMYEGDVIGHYLTAYVAPGKYDVGSTFIKFYVDGCEIPWIMREEMTFEEGGEYNFEVKVGKDRVSVWTDAVTVTDYPGGWNSDSEENLNAEAAIGTPDEGKNHWAVGDKVFVNLTSDHYGAQTVVYVFDGDAWECGDDWADDFEYLEGEVPTVTAIYAPCYAYDDGDEEIVLADGMQLGMTEYLEAKCSLEYGEINVNFAEVKRTYSRLRIVAQSNQTLAVTATDFTPVGTVESGTHTYTLTADDKGNAYLYGIFAEGANLTVNGATSMLHYTNGTEHNKSYAVCASHTAAEGAEATCLGYRCEQCGLYFGNKDESKHVTEMESNKATCQKQAVCDLCGTSYGEVDTNNHVAGCSVTYAPVEGGKHIGKRSCGVTTVAENHSFNSDGKCEVCGVEKLMINKVSVPDWADETLTGVCAMEVADPDEFTENTTQISEGNVTEGQLIGRMEWNENVGITVTDDNNPDDSDYTGSNVQWIHNGTSWDSRGNILYNKTGGQKISGYYPYSEDGSISYDLTQANYQPLYGTMAVTGSSVDLPVERKMAKLAVNIAGLPDGHSVQAVELNGIYLTADFDGATGFLTPDGDKGAIGMRQDGKAWTTMLIPMDQSEVTVRVKLQSGKVYAATFQLAPAAGKAYNLTVSLSHTKAPTCTPTADGSQHVASYPCCGASITENHTLTYTASGNAITATCSANCGYSETATISAENATYNGTEQTTASIAYSEGWTGGEPTVSYENNVNAGTATASITLGEATASVEFTIAKAEINIDDLVNPEFAANLVYDGTKKALVTAHGSVPGGTILYSLTYDGEYTSTIPVATEAGRYGVYWLIQGDENHEDILSPGWTQVIIAAKPGTDANITLGEYDSVYSGTAKEPGIASVVVDGVTLTAGKDYDVSYENNVYAGTAKAVITFKGNYSGTVTETFQISKAPLTVTADDKSMTTGRDLPAFTYTITGFVNGETEAVLTTKPTVSCEADGQTAGTYDITVSGAEAANYDITHVNGTLSVVDHQHAWTYTADGDTITAKCGNADTCPDAEQTIKIAAEGKTYDGTPVTATLTGNIDGVDTPAIRYFKNGTELNESVINAGTYTASITLGEATASVEFTITAASLADAEITVATGITYTGSAIEPDVTVKLGEKTLTGADYDVAYANNKNVGPATVTITGKGNYSGTASDSFRIERAKLTDISVQQNGKLPYDGGKALTPAVTANATALNGAKVYFIYSADGSAYGSMPTFTDAGTYTVYYCAYTVDNNFFDHHDTFTVTIDKATVTEPTIASKSYSGSAQTADVPASDLYTVEKNNGGTEKGSYDVVLKLKDSANYKWSTTDTSEVTLQFVISAAQNAWDTNPSISGWTYGEAAKTPVGTAKYGAVKVVYTGKANDGTDYNSETAPTKAGNYTATFTVTGTEDYSGLSEQVNFTIAKKAVTVTANDASKTYGESDPALTYTHTELVGSDALVITVARTSGENANTYTITASQAEGANPNYEITFKTGTFTIQKATLSVTAEDKTITYGDEVPAYTVRYEGFKNGDDKDDLGGTLDFYSYYRQFDDVGEYDICPHGLESDNYVFFYYFGKLTVNTKPITVTIQNATSVYGDTLAELKATDNGIVNGDTNVYSLATTVTGTSNVGKYTITGTALDSNYDVTFVNGEYEITKREITITVDAKNTVVNTTLPTYTYKVGGLVGVDTLVTEPTLTCNANIALIGEYDITATGADAGGNYSIKYVPAKLTVLTDNAVDAAAGYTEELKDYDPATVTSEDKAELDEMLSEINTILADETTTDNGKKALEEVKEQIEKLIKEINDAAEATDTENTEKVENVTPENVTPENKTDLEGAKADLEKALEENSGNYTEDEKKAIEDELGRIDEALEVIGNVEAVEKLIDRLPAVDTVKPDDEEAIKAITDAQTAYNALSDYEKSLVDEAAKANLDKLVAALVAYDIVEGDGSSWTEDSDHNITFVVNGLFSKFVGIKVDSKDVDKANYEVKVGSTIITLKASYLDTLAVGDHTITVVYTDGSTDGTFNVHAKANSPATGDDFNIALYSSLMAVSVTALVVLLLASKMRKQAK